MREDTAGSSQQGAGSMNLALRSGGSTGWQEHRGQGTEDRSQAAGPPAQTSRIREAAVGSSFACTRYSPPVTSHSARRTGGGFTLIELLVVVVIISILAALGLSTLGYVNRQGAESRARSEVAALSAAIESFKLERGVYPSNVASLYNDLCPAAPDAKVFFEPTPGMVPTNGSTLRFIDPWGDDYRYTNYTSYFLLISTAGYPRATTAPDTNNWIRN